jgi:hypothetical protein
MRRNLSVSEPGWRHLTTFSDFPSAQAFADALKADGIGVHLLSEAPLLGQASAARVFVESAQYTRARWIMSQSAVSDEELTLLSGHGPAD